MVKDLDLVKILSHTSIDFKFCNFNFQILLYIKYIKTRNFKIYRFRIKAFQIHEYII